jgi:parvulin-like peptidyl-prolyl isomerase
MIDPQTPLVTGAGVTLSLRDFLLSLHQRLRLGPMIMEAAAEKRILDTAREQGLTVSEAELQQAANRFRAGQGLATAEQTRAWLARQGMTQADFENAMQKDLLRDKVAQHVTGPRLAERFAAQRERYARARLRRIVVATEGLARELLTQITEDGKDFAEMAREHTLDLPSRSAGGAVGVVPRFAFPPPVAEAIFAAQGGAVVGPFPSGQGYLLFLVEEILPAELDAETTQAIRRELFDDCVNEQLRGARVNLAWLESI